MSKSINIKFTFCELLIKNLTFDMKVHLIKRDTINTYCKSNAQSRSGFEEWYSKLKYADWGNPEDMQNTFPNTDLLGNGTSRAVFDIGGNKYRLIAKFAFGDKEMHLFVCWIGTHAQYSKLCKTGQQYSISIY
jgi:mRNA interferase HigB